MLLCTGGCRSGKSAYAQTWVASRGVARVYIATAYASEDPEMQARISRHRSARGQGWRTVEAASGPWTEPERLVAEAAALGDALLFDCLTLWTSLCLERGLGETDALDLTARLLQALVTCGKPVAIVTNEVGMGLVPDNALGRAFRDLAGLVNQAAARRAETVVFMVSGLPLLVKGEGGPA